MKTRLRRGWRRESEREVSLGSADVETRQGALGGIDQTRHRPAEVVEQVVLRAACRSVGADAGWRQRRRSCSVARHHVVGSRAAIACMPDCKIAAAGAPVLVRTPGSSMAGDRLVWRCPPTGLAVARERARVHGHPLRERGSPPMRALAARGGLRRLVALARSRRSRWARHRSDLKRGRHLGRSTPRSLVETEGLIHRGRQRRRSRLPCER